MATQPETQQLNIREQIARIDKLIAETRVLGPSMIFQAMLATAALIGAGAAVAKLLF